MDSIKLTPDDCQVEQLGPCKISSPIRLGSHSHGSDGLMLTEKHRIRRDIQWSGQTDSEATVSFEQAGPRERIYFDPQSTSAAIVTCGGLSPGLNNVIRSVYNELSRNYGVQRVIGIQNGYQGLNPDVGQSPVELTPDMMESIDKLGGTCLGSSRGPQPPETIADFLESNGIDILFPIGGDGTQRGANAVHQELQRRGSKIAVVGIPKTIDNDIPFVRPTFGYATALEKAAEVIRGAHVEARGAINGVSVVKLMGRDAGFIAAGATIVSQEVNFTLVPEIEFPLEGENGFLESLRRRVEARGHAVVVVAEGAGQHLFESEAGGTDASGNRKRHDVGPLITDQIRQYFESRQTPLTLRYIDPSYFIRSVPANVYDRFLCDQMARNAVHAAMAGMTGMLIGLIHDVVVNIPIAAVVGEKKHLDVGGFQWQAVLQVTGQPRW